MTLEEFRYWLLAIGSWWFALNNFQLNLMKVWFLKCCFIKIASFPLLSVVSVISPILRCVFLTPPLQKEWLRRQKQLRKITLVPPRTHPQSFSDWNASCTSSGFHNYFCNWWYIYTYIYIFLSGVLKEKHIWGFGRSKGEEGEERICCIYKRSKVFHIFIKKNRELD